MNKRLLRIEIFQPTAHYRVPFAQKVKHTYPIPPYSTVKGLLANILGINKNIKEPKENELLAKLKETKMAIFGNFKSKSEEYTWLRNLSKDYHEGRFKSIECRIFNGEVEHPGGQLPAIINTLNDVNIYIYLYHSDTEFLKKIEDSFLNPTTRNEPLHLGRAEDIIIIENITQIEPKVNMLEGNYKMFFWIPQKPYTWGDNISFEFEKVRGLLYQIPTFYRIEEGMRQFEYITVKLNNGIITNIDFYIDSELGYPIFLADFAT
jgi:CRISPR-associated protein Cas5t